jgi:hypothetical protein
MPIDPLYCISDDDDTPMIRLDAESTTQRVIVWKCPDCGRYAREYPNYDAGSSDRVIVWGARIDNDATA